VEDEAVADLLNFSAAAAAEAAGEHRHLHAPLDAATKVATTVQQQLQHTPPPSAAAGPPLPVVEQRAAVVVAAPGATQQTRTSSRRRGMRRISGVGLRRFIPPFLWRQILARKLKRLMPGMAKRWVYG
jgi:hypothetical protein